MKPKFLWGIAGVVLVILVVVVARADLRRGHGWYGRGCHHHGPFGYVVRELNLSKEQTAEVRSIWGDERPRVAVLLGNLVDGTRQMESATAGGTFDEEKVRAVAVAEGNTFASLLVEKERFKARVYTTVLNEEQRQSAEKMQQRLLGRLEHAVSRLQKQGQ